ncbi:hypothetical protein BKA70DRAFT_518756 [Coprinopsis sp. MPI-PUGE-AT-0042]|nr:hypothetical protein BKA70DRAFT_518756 [Coprinopsis sp. MPI-PUGE-AT-0042]
MVHLAPSPLHLASTKAIPISRLVCCSLSQTIYTRWEFVEGDPLSYFDRRSQPRSSCRRYLKIPLLVPCLGILLYQAVNPRRLGSKDNASTGNRSHTYPRSPPNRHLDFSPNFKSGHDFDITLTDGRPIDATGTALSIQNAGRLALGFPDMLTYTMGRL